MNDNFFIGLSIRNRILIMITAVTLCSCGNNTGNNENRTVEVAPGIFVADSSNHVNSLVRMAEIFKGKPVYIDRWATWCSPCLEEFKYSEQLHKFLNDNKIEMLYLNSDGDIPDSTLYRFIISHNLRGYHLKLNDSLKKDLTEKKIFIPVIPQFLIMDKSGRIVNNKALRPGNGDSLYIQLAKYLKN